MQDFDRHKTQCRQYDDHSDGQPRRRFQQIEIKRGQIPHRGKAVEIIVLGLHLPVGEIKCAGDNNENPGRDRQYVRQQTTGGNRIGRNEHVSGEIDDQIECLARPARQRFSHVEFASQRAVEAVDDQRYAEAEEHARPMAAARQDHRQQRKRGSASGEDVNGESAKSYYRLPQSILTISADRPARFQLRPKPRKRDLSARETMTSGPIQYSLLRITTLPCSLPRTGVMAPSTYFSMRTMRVSPCVS